MLMATRWSHHAGKRQELTNQLAALRERIAQA